MLLFYSESLELTGAKEMFKPILKNPKWFSSSIIKVKTKYLIKFWNEENYLHLTQQLNYDVKKANIKNGTYFVLAKKDGEGLLIFLVPSNLYKEASEVEDIPENISLPIFYAKVLDSKVTYKYINWNKIMEG